ncbi:unnamed protein product, partial [Rotaria sp. Silwood1]
FFEFRTYEQYITPATLLAEALHCAIGDISCLRKASYQDIAAAQIKVNTMLPSLEFLLFFQPWVPVIDNTIVKDHLMEIVKNTSFPLKPLVNGTLTEEAIFYVYEAWVKPITLSFYPEIILFTFRANAFKMMERYPPIEVDDLRPLKCQMAIQWVLACLTRIYARQAASYSHVFGFPLDFDGWENETFCDHHVCHAGELPYTFESVWVNFADAGKRVAMSMATY